jgi:zinc/manganese transport system substrate-binding protein
MRRLLFTILAAGLLPGAAAPAGAQLRVVTTTTDLYDIARQVGGEHVRVVHISEGYQDPHFVEAKPSFILQLRNADVLAYVGLDLESGWLPVLLQGARNRKLQPGQPGHLDVSRAIDVLDVPRGAVDRSQGDVHARGNPHYWLHPDNARRIARMFANTFSALDPEHSAAFGRGAAEFERQLTERQARWAPLLAGIRGKPVVAYHTSWRYLADYTGMDIVGFMEPRPGVPPSPGQLAELMQTMQRTGARVILIEPFYDPKVANVVAQRTGATVLVLPPSVGGTRAAGDYFQLLDHILAQLAAALS